MYVGLVPRICRTPKLPPGCVESESVYKTEPFAARWKEYVKGLSVMHPSKLEANHRFTLGAALGLSLVAYIVLCPAAASWSQQSELHPSTQDYRIYLRGYTFDPMSETPTVPSEMRLSEAPGEAAYHIVQFTKSLTHAERARLRQVYGLRLTEYLPQLAFLEKMSARTLAAVSADSLYRASLPYHPGFKVSPNIGTLKFRTPDRQAMSGLLLRALLFPDADTDAAIEALSGNGASEIKVLDDRKIGGALRIMFTLPAKEILPRIARIEGMRWIEEVPEIVNDGNGNTAGTIQSGAAGMTPIWDSGIHGEGQIIGIIDSGPLDINHCFFRDAINNTPRPDHRKVLAIRNTSGTLPGGHSTFTSGNAAGDDVNNPGTASRRGSAWASRLVSGNNNDLRRTTLLAEFNAAAALGAMIHTNSWHDNTEGIGNPASYNEDAADVDTFVWNNENHLVLGSAGNIGEEQGPPGTAKNAIGVGATQADPNEMNFGDGNTGPTADGRRKPDLMAPGCGIQSATVNTACGTGPRSTCATSYATPHTAGAAALIRQYYTEGWYPSGTRQPHDAFIPSGALLKATLINSTLDMTGIFGYPSNLEGWGVIRLNNVLFFPGSAKRLRVWDTRNAGGLNTGESRMHTFNVASNGQPLRVTLVWSDPPGSAGAAHPVINNLDLAVTSPDGTQRFIGNNFNAGATPSNSGAAADVMNNTEMLVVNTPAPGDWTITVTGTAVNVGSPGQGYALVVTADISDRLPPPHVEVTSPNGGQKAKHGKTFTITWSASSSVGIISQDIELSTDKGATFSIMIASNLSGDLRSFDWSVPVDLERGKVYRVRVVAHDSAGGSGSDSSDTNFKIK